MTKKPSRIYQLDISRVDGIEDIKKILDGLQLRISTDDILFEEVEHLFTTEVIPRGYRKVLEKVGDEKINQMTWEEIEEMGLKLLQEIENSEEES